MNRLEAQTFVDAIKSLRDNATDAQASMAIGAYPILKKDSSPIKAETRINWNGTLKRATVDLWDTKENNPDNAPTLWADLPYKDGYRIIPETITVTSVDIPAGYTSGGTVSFDDTKIAEMLDAI